MKNKISQKKRRSKQRWLKNPNRSLEKTNFSFFSWKFYLPHNWNIITLRRKNQPLTNQITRLFNKVYYFQFAFPHRTNHPLIDIGTRVVSCRFRFYPNFLPLFTLLIQRILHFFTLPFFFKLKFKGKGYYVYKNKRLTVTPQFGLAHRRFFYAASFFVKFLSKTTIFLFGFSKVDILDFSHSFKNTKPINVFTGRGVRFSKQIVYKKTGKVSTYR